MVSVVITNLTSAVLDLPELYVSLGKAGSSSASVTITRSVADLDSMADLQKKLVAASISMVATNSSDNSDMFSIAMEQHGKSGALAVTSAVVVTEAVTFAKPFPSGVTPNIDLTVVMGATTNWKATAYARSVTNTGFTIALDVTTLSGTGGATGVVHWKATY